MNIKFFIFFYILQICIALPYFKTCNNINFITLSIFLLHHIVDVYGYFGVFINETIFEYQLHLFMTLLILLHWYTNNYKCYVTVKLNELCKRDLNTWEYNIVGLISTYTNIYYLHSYILIAIILYDITKIYDIQLY
jgi:hypothetical protein